ncbi:hypothetical protein [Leptothoe kymatousa]|uniref:DUF2442 domain-containing protein n=1 Tax=Leptothoe kymatousa TAU-MAC 1615 TaxID=2364775 RepID=A0ABS5Y4U8_9CYAN|nr:hypothetical protein [Leptothoe kymatousa]MBT9312836.1 hypothetical protein [Leptothoe kymatousa TAU-MAC 1615]
MLWEAWKAYASDESHWLESQEKGLLKAEYLTGYILRLWFEEILDVSIFDLDFEPLLMVEEPGAALVPLKELERFQFVKGDGALIWPNPETGNYDERAIDLAPECVRFFCERYGKVVKPFEAAAT